VICDRWDVAVVPFPFTDRPAGKRRPALVLSPRAFNRHGHTIMTMVTTSGHSAWPGDTQLTDHATAGLRLPCTVRLKLFTLDNRLILRRAGRLAAKDQKAVAGRLREVLTG